MAILNTSALLSSFIDSSSDYEELLNSASYAYNETPTDDWVDQSDMAQFSMTVSRSTTQYVTFGFKPITIPDNAIVTNVTFTVRAAYDLVESTTDSFTCTARLYAGSTAKGSSATLGRTYYANPTKTGSGGSSWTAAQLQDARIRISLKKDSGWYSYDAVMYVQGASIEVEYSVPDIDAKVTIGDNAKTVREVHAHVDGEWKTVKKTYAKVNGKWILSGEYHPEYTWKKYTVDSEYQKTYVSGGYAMYTDYDPDGVLGDLEFSSNWWGEGSTRYHSWSSFTAWSEEPTLKSGTTVVPGEINGPSGSSKTIDSPSSWNSTDIFKYCSLNGPNSSRYWGKIDDKAKYGWFTTHSSSDSRVIGLSIDIYCYDKVNILGTNVGSITSTDPDKFPDNGIHTDGYWYVKQSS